MSHHNLEAVAVLLEEVHQGVERGLKLSKDVTSTDLAIARCLPNVAKVIQLSHGSKLCHRVVVIVRPHRCAEDACTSDVERTIP